jgi:hypothetical protein
MCGLCAISVSNVECFAIRGSVSLSLSLCISLHSLGCVGGCSGCGGGVWTLLSNELLNCAWLKSNIPNKHTTPSNGYRGSHNDEERSEMRYVMRIAEFSESSNL